MGQQMKAAMRYAAVIVVAFVVGMYVGAYRTEPMSAGGNAPATSPNPAAGRGKVAQSDLAEQTIYNFDDHGKLVNMGRQSLFLTLMLNPYQGDLPNGEPYWFQLNISKGAPEICFFVRKEARCYRRAARDPKQDGLFGKAWHAKLVVPVNPGPRADGR